MDSSEMIAAKRVAEAKLHFLIAWEEGRRLRTPEAAPPQFEVKLPEFLSAPKPKPEQANERAPKPADSGQLISVGEVAKLLECSTRTVYRLADWGKPPRPRKIGQLVRWPIGEIREWIEDGCPRQRSVRARSRC